MKSQRLPDAEYEIMDFIWDTTPPVTTSMVMARIGQQRQWKIQTVVTLFARLTERGFLRVERGSGRERSFYPILSREEYLRMETRSFVRRYHKENYVSLFNALHRDDLSDRDLDELSSWVQTLRDAKERMD